jgi:hypothetical protein
VLPLLCGAVLLQAWDVTETYSVLQRMRTAGFISPLQSRFWEVVPPHYRRIVLFPSRMCTAEATFDFRPFVLVAGRHGMAINAGAAARAETPQVEAYCRALEQDIDTATIDSDALYILRSDLVTPFKARSGESTICMAIDAHDVCVARRTVVRWQGQYDIPADAR